MNELVDLRIDCIDLLKRLDTQESCNYTEDIIEEVSNFCSKLEIFGPKVDEALSGLMNRIQEHFIVIFLREDRVPFYVREKILRTLDLRNNNWDEEKLDREYYEKLNHIARELFGKKDTEAEDKEQEGGEGDLMTFSDDEDEGHENEERKQEAEYERVVNVGGLKINLFSDNLQILNKSASSLSDFSCQINNY